MLERYRGCLKWGRVVDGWEGSILLGIGGGEEHIEADSSKNDSSLVEDIPIAFFVQSR